MAGEGGEGIVVKSIRGTGKEQTVRDISWETVGGFRVRRLVLPSRPRLCIRTESERTSTGRLSWTVTRWHVHAFRSGDSIQAWPDRLGTDALRPCGCLVSSLVLSMDNRSSSTVAKKSKFLRNPFTGKLPKSANASTSQPNSARVGAHDLVPKHDAGSADLESIASGKHITIILVL